MEIQNELSGGCSRALGTNHSGYEVYFDLEKQENSGELGDRNQPESDGVKGSDSDNEKRLSGIEQTSPKRPRPTHFVSSVSVSDHIRAVSNRLSQEVERAQPSTVRESAGSSSGATMYGGEDDRDGRTEDPNVLPKVVGCAKMLKAQFSVGRKLPVSDIWEITVRFLRSSRGSSWIYSLRLFARDRSMGMIRIFM